MSQALQDWYLATLGIVRYVPRDAFHIAQEKKGVAETIARPSSAQPVSKKTGASDIQSRPGIVPLEKPAKPVEPTPDAETLVPEQQTIPASFSYAVWQPVDDLLVINDLLDAQSVSGQQLQLLANMLKAINRWHDPASLPRTEYLKWPLQQGDNSASGASTLLSMFLSSRIKKHGVCWVLLMGKGTLQYLDAIDSGAANPVGMPGGAKGLSIPTLAEMLQEPSLKKRAWQVIKPLAGKT